MQKSLIINLMAAVAAVQQGDRTLALNRLEAVASNESSLAALAALVPEMPEAQAMVKATAAEGDDPGAEQFGAGAKPAKGEKKSEQADDAFWKDLPSRDYREITVSDDKPATFEPTDATVEANATKAAATAANNGFDGMEQHEWVQNPAAGAVDPALLQSVLMDIADQGAATQDVQQAVVHPVDAPAPVATEVTIDLPGGVSIEVELEGDSDSGLEVEADGDPMTQAICAAVQQVMECDAKDWSAEAASVMDVKSLTDVDHLLWRSTPERSSACIKAIDKYMATIATAEQAQKAFDWMRRALFPAISPIQKSMLRNYLLARNITTAKFDLKKLPLKAD